MEAQPVGLCLLQTQASSREAGGPAGNQEVQASKRKALFLLLLLAMINRSKQGHLDHDMVSHIESISFADSAKIAVGQEIPRTLSAVFCGHI